MGPKALLAIGWRNIWRNRRRTIITLCSIVFGSFLAVLLTGIGDSTYGNMIDTAARMGNGHVTVQHPTHHEAPSPKRYVKGAFEIADKLGKDAEVITAVPRISGQMMVSTAGESRGTAFIAIDPARENKDTLLALKGLTEGELFKADDANGIVLGATLAKHLGAKIGRKVVYTMTDRHGEIFTGLGRVRGLVKTGSPGIDNGLCLLPIQAVQKALDYGPKDATLVAVVAADQRRSAAIAQRLRGDVSEQHAVKTWHQTMASLASFIDMKLSGTAFIEGLLMILVAAGIFNALLVSVMERRRELGILTALGWSRLQLFGMVMAESFWLAIVGLISAALVTAGPYYHLSTKGVDMSEVYGTNSATVANVTMDATLYVKVHPDNFVFLVVAVLLATMASGLIPAWQAGRVDPVESIKLV